MSKWTLASVLFCCVALLGVSYQLQAQEAKPAQPAAAPHGAHGAAPAPHQHGMASMPLAAVAVLSPTEGNKAQGIVRFNQIDNGVKVVADIDGLEPNSVHGFHIHEFGDISSKDGSSLGGHFNPQGHPHGGPADEKRHAGDMGNVTADDKGHAHLELALPGVSVPGPRNSILGRGVVLHAKADDLKSQPTGDAGGRIAVGAIGVAKNPEPAAAAPAAAPAK